MRNASTPQHHVNFPRRQRPLDPVARPATMHRARPRAGARPRPFFAAHVVLAAVAAWASAPHPAAGDCVETTVSPEPLKAPNSPGPCRTFARLCLPAKRAAVTCRVQHMPRQSAMVPPAAHPRSHMRQELARPTACPCQPPRHRRSQRAWPCRTRPPTCSPWTWPSLWTRRTPWSGAATGAGRWNSSAVRWARYAGGSHGTSALPRLLPESETPLATSLVFVCAHAPERGARRVHAARTRHACMHARTPLTCVLGAGGARSAAPAE